MENQKKNSPDSLDSCIGNVYVVKTGPARTTGVFEDPLYVKIKILDFDVLDSASYKIQMIFLWLANMNGKPNLVSEEPLDTFTTLPGVFDEEGTEVWSQGPSFRRQAIGENGRTGVVPRVLVSPIAGRRAGVVIHDYKNRKSWTVTGRALLIKNNKPSQ